MQAYGQRQGVAERNALREQRAEHAGKDVAGATGGEPRVAAAVDRPVSARISQHAAGAFEDDAGVEPARHRQRGFDPVRLDVRRLDAGKPRRFGGMRRDDRRGASRDHRRGQRRIGRDQGQRVGIDHQRRGQPQRAVEQMARRFTGAESGSDDDRVERSFEHICRAAQHQLRLLPIDCRPVGRGEAHQHFAGAQVKRGARRQQRRADHPVAAADDAQRAEAALVHIAARTRQRVGQCGAQHRPIEQLAGRCRHVTIGNVEAMHADCAAVVGSIQGQQTGLQGDESRRGAGADRGRLRDARFGVEPARHVERQDRYAAVIGLHDPARVYLVDRAGKSDAEQTVDDEAEVAIVAPVRYDRTASLAPCGARGRGIGRHARGAVERADDDVEKPRGKMPRHDERVAAVVARSGQHQHARSTVRQHVAGVRGSRKSCTLHQRLPCHPRLDGADVRDATDRLETHRLIIGTVSPSRAPDKRASRPGRAIRQRLHQSIH